jgi:hypothetical protein
MRLHSGGRKHRFSTPAPRKTSTFEKTTRTKYFPDLAKNSAEASRSAVVLTTDPCLSHAQNPATVPQKLRGRPADHPKYPGSQVTTFARVLSGKKPGGRRKNRIHWKHFALESFPDATSKRWLV